MVVVLLLAGLPLPAASVAAFCAMVTVTAAALLAGVMVAVHTRPAVVLVNALAVPLVTVMSPAIKLLTVSLKLNVAVNALRLPCTAGTPLIVTVGATVSW